jgi:dTDP-4-amino-4,6-dideoxygalactose transaminase
VLELDIGTDIEGIFDAGGVPVFLDVDDTATVDASWIEPRITPRTKAILPVHLYGQPADMDAVMEIARRHALPVLEDCAQAHGAEHRGRKVGTIDAAGALSFDPSKNLPVPGDGGAVLTDDDAIATSLRMLRDHGRRDKHVHQVAAFNMRFNDLQAQAGRVFPRCPDGVHHVCDVRREVLPRTDTLVDVILSLPVFPSLTEAEQEHAIASVQSFFATS